MSNSTQKTKIVSNSEVNAIVEAIRLVKKEKKECERREKALVQKLYNFMNEHDVLIDYETGQETVNWSYSSGYMKFDAKKFAEDRPKMYERYCTMTDPVRTLRIAK